MTWHSKKNRNSQKWKLTNYPYDTAVTTYGPGIGSNEVPKLRSMENPAESRISTRIGAVEPPVLEERGC